MNAAQALLSSLATSRRQATTDYLAAHADEHISLEPPVWCHACGRMLVAHGRLLDGGQRVVALCPDCAVTSVDVRDRRQPCEQRLRELVEVTRLLAWQAQDSAATYDDRGCHESARVLRELAAAAEAAINALRITPREG